MIFGHFRLAVPSLETNAFLVGCEETKEAMLIDAGIFEDGIQSFLAERGLRITTVFLTHHHWDHTDGLPDLLAAWPDTTVYYRESNFADTPTVAVKQGDQLSLGSIRGRIVETPGHTPDANSLIIDATPDCPGMVFAGDALFAGSVGGTSTPEDHQTQLESVRKQLFTLPDHYEVHVGHGPSSTIGVERRFNPFFV